MKQAARQYDQCHMNQNFTQIHTELAELLPAGLRSFCTTSVHERGERLFTTGAKPSQMFFIGSGEVILERAGAQGGLVILQRTRHGFIGEASLQSARYHCDAK